MSVSEIAPLNIKLRPKDNNGIYVSLNEALSFFAKINDSFNKLIESEAKIQNLLQQKEAITAFKKQYELLFTDLKIGSFETVIIPQAFQDNQANPLFSDNMREWGKNIYEQYQTFLTADFNDLSFIQETSERYNTSELSAFLKPLFSIRTNYNASLINQGTEIKIQPVDKEIVTLLTTDNKSNENDISESLMFILAKKGKIE